MSPKTTPNAERPSADRRATGDERATALPAASDKGLIPTIGEAPDPGFYEGFILAQIAPAALGAHPGSAHGRRVSPRIRASLALRRRRPGSRRRPSRSRPLSRPG